MTKRFNRSNRQSVLHFITLNVRESRRAFSRDAYARASLIQLREHCDLHPAKLIAYVAMPTHLHAVLNPRDGEINRFLGQYKPAVTMSISTIAQQMGHQSVLDWLRQTPDGHQQLWQDGKHNFHLYTERLIWQKINYIHNNPLRAKLVKHASDYLYSSFNAMYQTGKEVIVPIDIGFWWED